ncbi:beta-galactosidase [Lactonifactor longoviformis]|uniref:beta-galactosidase n=1 Tax=Lactonifactor longoviformis DSM 17459 TaxID=1122155 RepID=A0A1M5CV12_9CLOT|nr:glycoside hydrolase family 2 TIM barrel-domain containing protein [Lactonifactor longoviformis]POP31204.1 beta-galactosidase [Lactonifactor longoviformis]SHF58585.1 beta-galactosidase [Lactonifactor longoviformis DSM 17459]
MEADIRWIDNPEVFRVNQLPAHSDHEFYHTTEELLHGKSSLVQSLDGQWQFHYSINASVRPVSFYKKDFNAADFDWITVPGHIELAGYDKNHYINTMYPWEGHEFRRPAFSMEAGNTGEGSFSSASWNPVGSYLCRFDLKEGMRGMRINIRFEGVEQAMYVWLNGAFIGYAEDSFTPSEFDLSPYIEETGNILAVEVHKRSTAAFLEDQDFFRFFGIFRSVSLYARPGIHLEDMWAKPFYRVEEGVGELELELKLSCIKQGGTVRAVLQDEEGHICMEQEETIKEKMKLVSDGLGKVTPWEYGFPYLYTLLLELRDADGNIQEIVPYKIGFRTIEICGRVIFLNGRRLILNGVNRHEWSARRGRAVTEEEMDWDIRCMQRNHINAVRTCHYPNQIPWYAKCDKAGIYIMSETNLESHGSWQKMGAVEPSWNVPGSIPQWREAVLDRARTHFETFKNHVSIIFWSLGNESYVGENIKLMQDFFRQSDPTRLIHYEGVFHNRVYGDAISDVESQMYAPPGRIREYLEHNPSKPFILCEYMHNMGNSLGGLKSYMELLDQYEMYQGGFIWDFIDQALWTEDEVTGEAVLRYGGDFDDRPSDYEFSANGIVFADRTEKPAMQEVRYYYGKYR